MENLVVSVFFESEAYQSFADLKAFRQTQTTKVAQIALVKEISWSHRWKRTLWLWIQRRMQPLEGGLLRCSYRALGGPIGVLFGYGNLYGLAAGDLVSRQKLADWLVSQNWSTAKQPLSPWTENNSHRCLLRTTPRRALGCSNRRSRIETLCKSKKISTTTRHVHKWGWT